MKAYKSKNGYFYKQYKSTAISIVAMKKRKDK